MTLFVNILTKYNVEKNLTQNPFDEKAADLTRVESIRPKKRKGIREFGSIQWLHHNNKNTSIIRLNLVTHDSSQLSCFECVLYMDFQHLIICKRMVVHMLKMPQNERKGIERDIKYSNSMKKKTFNWDR